MDHPLPPNLDDAVERQAYRRELRGVAIGWRLFGFALLAAAVLVYGWHPQARGAWISLFLLALAALAVAVVKRTRYHRRRMGGQKV